MTDPSPARDLAKKAGRKALGPVTDRLDLLRRDMEHLFARQDELAAAMEQATAATHRLEAYFDRYRAELDASFDRYRSEIDRYGDELDAQIGSAATGAQSIVAELAPEGGPALAGEELRERLDHTLLHAEAIGRDTRVALDRQIGELRNGTRLTQSLMERVLANSVPRATGDAQPVLRDTPASSAPEGSQAPAAASFEHPVPSFDLLYRGFEDRHRGTPEMITERQGADYLAMIDALPHPELPVADLGCGRGELVRLLDEQGMAAIGIDANHGQVADGDDRLFVEDDLFRWLDAQYDASHRAVVAMHVVEHLPLDLQVRLVFEARRVVAEGGLVVLETPNLYSLSTAATNFWVDPTHERPVHPLFLEFLAEEAGFLTVELQPLHELAAEVEGAADAPELANHLDRMLFGHGDIALVAWR